MFLRQGLHSCQLHWFYGDILKKVHLAILQFNLIEHFFLQDVFLDFFCYLSIILHLNHSSSQRLSMLGRNLKIQTCPFYLCIEVYKGQRFAIWYFIALSVHALRLNLFSIKRKGKKSWARKLFVCRFHEDLPYKEKCKHPYFITR